MLRNIPPLISPDLLHIIASMGHGDEIVIADANFPGASHGQRYCRIDGAQATDVVSALLELFPLDEYVDNAAYSMQVVGDPKATPPIVAEFQHLINENADHPTDIKPIDRFEFYERAKEVFAVVQTTEFRLYGNLILKKGVIGK